MASPETRQDGSTATQRLRAMQQTRPSVAPHRPDKFVRSFMSKLPGANDMAKQAIASSLAAAGVNTAQPAPPPAQSQAGQMLTGTQMRALYTQLQSRPHNLSPAEMVELRELLNLDG